MLVLGVDENGLGPQLGPLIATSFTLITDKYIAKDLYKHGLSLGIADSKASSAFGKMSHCESVALALIEMLEKREVRSVDALIDAISIDGTLALRSPCPSPKTAAQCWKHNRALPCFGGDITSGRRILSSVFGKTLQPFRIRTAITCAGVLNKTMDAGTSKLKTDLLMFERLILDAVGTAKAKSKRQLDFQAICGMVGGIRKYEDHFSHFSKIDSSSEVKGLCRYQVRDVGDVAFEVKADAKHFPVALASMVGKYVRELLMDRIMQFYLAHDPSLDSVSGYHDPNTKRFVRSSTALRRKLKIVEDCFARRR